MITDILTHEIQSLLQDDSRIFWTNDLWDYCNDKLEKNDGYLKILVEFY